MVGISHQPAPTASDTRSELQKFVALASELDVPALAAAAEALAQRTSEGRFYVACVGQFKRGKSTLINALLGERLLPTGVAPVTSVITVVRYGDPRAVIQFRDRTEHTTFANLSAYVSERENPANAKGVLAVEAFVPSRLLASGMCLVDTPGVGSTHLDNTETTKRFVPHIDAALIVLGADPPISADELELVDAIAREAGILMFVLNKADRTTDRERAEARQFCSEVIASRLGRPVDPLLEISATDQLSGEGDSRDWNLLYRRLEALADQSASALLVAAEQRGLRILIDRALREVQEREDALRRPIEQSVRRIEQLRRCAADAERALRDLRYLLTAEEDHLASAFEQSQRAYLDRTLPIARAELAQALRDLVGTRAMRWRESNRLARDVFHRFLAEWRADQQPHAEAMYGDAMVRFSDLANSFMERLAADSTIPPTELPELLETERSFRTPSRLFFTDLMHWNSRSPLQWMADAFRTRRSFNAAVDRHAFAYLERLMASNASRLTNALREQVLENRRRLEQELRQQWREVHIVAERALQRARTQRSAGDAAIRAELDRLLGLRRDIEQLRGAPTEAY